jgi:hypothetical protein
MKLLELHLYQTSCKSLELETCGNRPPRPVNLHEALAVFDDVDPAYSVGACEFPCLQDSPSSEIITKH